MRNNDKNQTELPRRFSREFLFDIGLNLLILVIAIVVLNVVLVKIFSPSRHHLDPLTESRIGGFQN